MSTMLTIGKIRGLQQCSTLGGVFSVLALDHRNNLRHALCPQAPQTVADGDMMQFKRQVISALAPAASAALLDPEVGAAQCIASGALPGDIGLLAAVEATGYTGDPTARQSGILAGWSVEKARRMGASAVKLLVYYHPAAPTAAEIEALVRQTANDCRNADMPLFLEPLSYSLDPATKSLPAAEKQRVVVETARRLTVPGVEVLKAEFPTSPSADEKTWEQACAELSQACPIPWVLLSASVPFDVFLRQVTTACRAGASGVAVGRAVWQEAPALQGVERSAFLNGEARRRMERVTALCAALARPWQSFFEFPSPDAGWYARY